MHKHNKCQIFLFLFSITTQLLSIDIKTIDSNYTRINPASNSNMLFSFHSSIKDAKNAVVNIYTEKK